MKNWQVSTLMVVAFASGWVLWGVAHADVQASKERIFQPEVASYLDGQFLDVVVSGEPKESMKECLDTLQHLIGPAMENGKIPHGGAALGACVSLPKNFTVTQ